MGLLKRYLALELKTLVANNIRSACAGGTSSSRRMSATS